MHSIPRTLLLFIMALILGSCRSGDVTNLPASGSDSGNFGTPSASAEAPEVMQPLPKGELQITRNNRTLLKLTVQIAETGQAQAKGLMFVRDLPRLEGMAFLWPVPIQAAFYMKNTLIPLDIAFWDESMRIVEIQQMAPCKRDPCPLYQPVIPYVGALEVNRGLLRSEGVRVGDLVSLSRRR